MIVGRKQNKMSVLPTFVDTASEEYQRNYAAMRALLELEVAQRGGGERTKFRELLQVPRELSKLLLDPGTPFPGQTGGLGTDGRSVLSAVNGIGVVSGVEWTICANDATAKGCSAIPCRSSLRAHSCLPCVYLVESAGANRPDQAEFFADLGGRTFANQQVAHGGHPADRARLRLLNRCSLAYVPWSRHSL